MSAACPLISAVPSCHRLPATVTKTTVLEIIKNAVRLCRAAFLFASRHGRSFLQPFSPSFLQPYSRSMPGTGSAAGLSHRTRASQYDPEWCRGRRNGRNRRILRPRFHWQGQPRRSRIRGRATNSPGIWPYSAYSLLILLPYRIRIGSYSLDRRPCTEFLEENL